MRKLARMRTGLIALVLLMNLLRLGQAQYGGDPYRGYIDQMVIDRMNRRRLEERVKSRPHWKKQRRQSSSRSNRTVSPSSSRKKSASAQRVAHTVRSVPTGSLSLAQDMYSRFGNSDSRGYILEATLTPLGRSGRVIKQQLRLNSNQGDRTGVMSKVPAGRYTLTARSVGADGTARPALVGTECGSPTDPNGGNFARSLPVTLEAIKNQWGNTEVRCRQPIWFRP